MKLSPKQVESYRENGFLIVEGLVSRAELQELKDDTLKLCRGEYPHPAFPPLPANLSDNEVLEHYLCLHQVHRISPVMMKYIAHPGMAQVLSQIVAPDVKCMQSMLFVKPPDFPGQAWHQDELYIPTRDRSLTGGWIAIDEATKANGCLWVVPGSHRTGYLWPQKAHEQPDEFDFAPMSYGFDEREEIPVEVPAGSAVFFNGYTLHRSRRNRSNIYRRVLVNHYMNAYSLLPWNIPVPQQPVPKHVSAGQADFRDVIMVAGKDPYEWKGYTRENGAYARPCEKIKQRQAAEKQLAGASK
ncbi:MAG: phytanoyl-CoA dioxygenase family protein [Planctomycetes bacterium]|nr:phytanoyl-CoA dioxygenase family protein [Planctomycetota bacterium]